MLPIHADSFQSCVRMIFFFQVWSPLTCLSNLAPCLHFSTGSGHLLRCIPCCLLLFFRSDSCDVQLLLPPPAPSPPETLSASHAFTPPPASTSSTAGSLPAAPPYPAAASTSHSSLQPNSTSPQPPSRSCEPWRKPWRLRVHSAALWPGYSPVGLSHLFLQPLTSHSGLWTTLKTKASAFTYFGKVWQLDFLKNTKDQKVTNWHKTTYSSFFILYIETAVMGEVQLFFRSWSTWWPGSGFMVTKHTNP